MANDRSGALDFVPFFEPEASDNLYPDRFVAGFKGSDGTRWGVVPLECSIVERAVLLSITFKPHLDSNGMVQPWPKDNDDEMFGEMMKLGLLEKAGLDDLIAETLEADQNEPDHGADGVLPEYVVLRYRLQAGPVAVDARRPWSPRIFRRITRKADRHSARIANSRCQAKFRILPGPRSRAPSFSGHYGRPSLRAQPHR